MPYEYYIQQVQPDSPDEFAKIPLAKWKKAVEITEGVRLFALTEQRLTVPGGGTMVMPVSSGSAEVFFPEDAIWILVFRWDSRRGSVSFNANGVDFGNPLDPVWQVVTQLIKVLNASVYGSEGEQYNLETGKPI
jgi:hypothetical protein